MEISRISQPPTGAPHVLSAVPSASGAIHRSVAGTTNGIRADSVLLQSGLGAALTAELIRLWEGSTTLRFDGVIAYEAARRASTPEIALIHLERAIKANPEYATAAMSDPEFLTLREPAANMIEHLKAAARLEAQAAMREAEQAVEAEAIDADSHLRETAAILNASEARYQWNTYAGYIEAAIAARLAHRIAIERVKVKNLSRSSIVDRIQRVIQPLRRIGVRAAEEMELLWQRFPLFAILLGWFCVGVGFGLLTRAFGAWTGIRWLLGYWGMGLLAIVMLGFVRSLRK